MMRARIITRPPEDKDPYRDEKIEYHTKLRQAGINLVYDKKVHAKLIVIDREVAIVSSMNFYSSSSGGRSWEAGLVSIEEKMANSVAQSILKFKK